MGSQLNPGLEDCCSSEHSSIRRHLGLPAPSNTYVRAQDETSWLEMQVAPRQLLSKMPHKISVHHMILPYHLHPWMLSSFHPSLLHTLAGVCMQCASNPKYPVPVTKIQSCASLQNQPRLKKERRACCNVHACSSLVMNIPALYHRWWPGSGVSVSIAHRYQSN